MEKEINNPQWYQVAELELVYKTKVKPSQRPRILKIEDSFTLLRQVWNPEKIEMVEEFKVLLLNRANRVLGVFLASLGGIAGTIVDPGIILAAAVKANASSMILAHNHPSGNLKPSRHDEEVTRKIIGAAQFLNIKVLDHVIITAEDFFSFAKEGLL